MKIIFVLIFLFTNSFLFSQSWDWAKSFGVKYGPVESGKSIGVDNSNNLYVAGTSYMPKSGPNNGWGYSWFKKFDNIGNALWMDTISIYDPHLITDQDGNSYIFGGGILSKYDNQGQKKWQQYFGRIGIFSVALYNNDIIMIGAVMGYTGTIGSTIVVPQTAFMAKADKDGNWLWVQKYTDYTPLSLSINQNGLIFTTASAFDSETEYNVRIFDQNGNCLKGLLNLKHILPFIATDSKKNFYLVAGIADYAPLIINTDTIRCYCGNASTRVLIKFDENGIYQWHKIIKQYVTIDALIIDKDDNPYVGGNIIRTLQIDSFLLENKVSSIYVSKFNENGQTLWIKNSEQPAPNVGYGQLNSMILDSQNNLVITGSITDKHIFGNITLTGHDNLYSDLMIAKIKQEKVIGVNEPQFSLSNGLNVYPNPTEGLFTAFYRSEKASALTLKIINQLGQVILVKNYPEQKEVSETFDLSPFAKGIYFVQVKSTEDNEVKKIILE